jgi:hypothetical protein
MRLNVVVEIVATRSSAGQFDMAARKWYKVTLATSAANAGQPVVMHCTRIDADRTLCVESMESNVQRGQSGWQANIPRRLLHRMAERWEEETDPTVLARLRRIF